LILLLQHYEMMLCSGVQLLHIECVMRMKISYQNANKNISKFLPQNSTLTKLPLLHIQLPP
jgi:hypothetical protein